MKKNIIVKEISTYIASEQMEIVYVTLPQITEISASLRHKDISKAFVFDFNSKLLKYHPQETKKTIHFNYGVGITKTEWIYTDKISDIEDFTKKRERSDMKIDIAFPKVVKDINIETLNDN